MAASEADATSGTDHGRCNLTVSYPGFGDKSGGIAHHASHENDILVVKQGQAIILQSFLADRDTTPKLDF